MRERNQHLISNLKRAGVTSAKLLDIMGRVQRRAFVKEKYVALADGLRVVPLERGQYIQHAITTAQILEAAELENSVGLSVLVVGGGSMYSSALIRSFGCTVTTLERQPDLVRRGIQTLKRLNFTGINVYLGNGLDGWKTSGPYDRIILFGSAENVRPALHAQLKPNGVIIIPADIDGEPALLRGKKSEPTEILPLFEPLTPLEDSKVVFDTARFT